MVKLLEKQILQSLNGLFLYENKTEYDIIIFLRMKNDIVYEYTVNSFYQKYYKYELQPSVIIKLGKPNS